MDTRWRTKKAASEVEAGFERLFEDSVRWKKKNEVGQCRVDHAWYRGRGESLVPPHTRGGDFLSLGARRKPCASVYTRKRLSPLTALGVSAWSQNRMNRLQVLLSMSTCGATMRCSPPSQ